MENNPLGELKIHHTRKETRQRIKGIVASHEFEGMKPTRREIHWLKKLGYGEITQEDYEYHVGLMSENERAEYKQKKAQEKKERHREMN